jgi:hypothetical protein
MTDYQKIRDLMKNETKRLWEISNVPEERRANFEVGVLLATAGSFFADLSEEKKAYWINYFNKDAS